MDKEILEVLKAIRGEIVMLRNDFLMLRVAVEQIETEVKKPKEPQNLDKFYGPNTYVEKF